MFHFTGTVLNNTWLEQVYRAIAIFLPFYNHKRKQTFLVAIYVIK